MKEKIIKIGAIIGSGTGEELTQIFESTICHLVKNLGGPSFEIIKFPKILHSYWAMRNKETSQIIELSKRETQELWEWVVKFYENGGRAIFRTAINAETLYNFRKIGQAIKIIRIKLRDGRKILIIRDEMQGFYTVNNYHIIGKEKVIFEEEFSYEYWEKVMNFSKSLADVELKENYLFRAIYKHHLFANILEKWLSNWKQKTNIEAHLYQPDTGLTHLFSYLVHSSVFPRDLLMVVGNEVGDIIYEWLMFHLKIGSKDTLYTENVYLHPKIKNLRIFQTVHGSADDIANSGKVNPVATLRAASALLSFITNDTTYSKAMENILKDLTKEKIFCDDWLKEVSTKKILDFVYARLKSYGKKNL